MVSAFQPPQEADGGGVERCAKGPDHHYEIGSFRLGRYGWFRWEATLHGSGVGNRRTPVGAMLGAWRFRREMARNPRKYLR